MVRKWMAIGSLFLVVAMLSGCGLRERRGGLLARYRGQCPCATFVPYQRPMSPATPAEYTIAGPIWDAPVQPGCGNGMPGMPPFGTPPPTTTEPPQNGTAPRSPASPSKLMRPGQTASETK